MLASVLQAASSELLKTKASEAFVHLVSSRGPIRLYFIITSRGFTREDVCLGSQAKSKMLSLTLILLLAVEAQKNRAPVCAIGLKKGARVRLPQGARKASPALQIRVRKQLPIPIIPGAHVATLKNCHKDVGAFRQT